MGVWCSPLRQASGVYPALPTFACALWAWGAAGLVGLARNERFWRWMGTLKVRLRQRPLPVSADPSGGPPQACLSHLLGSLAC